MADPKYYSKSLTAEDSIKREVYGMTKVDCEHSLKVLLSFFSLLFYCIYYSDIRVKAISRIIKNDNRNEIKIVTDV